MKKNNVSTYELWRGKKPNLGYLKVWGCLAYCKSTKPKRTKLGPRAIKCAFVGYASNSKAYRLLDLESNVIIESRKMQFFETLLYSDNKSQEPISLEGTQEELPSRVVEQPIFPRRIQRLNQSGSQNKTSQVETLYLVEGNHKGVTWKFPMVLQVEDDPKTFQEEMSSRDSNFFGKRQ